MKKFLQSGLAIALFLTFAACSSDDNNNVSPPVSSEQSITATVNGQPWTGTLGTCTLIRYVSENQQRFDINAEDGSQRLLLACESEVTATAGVPVRTYTFTDGGEPSDALFVNDYKIKGNYFMEHFPTDGVITITNIDTANKKISGTFSFNAEKVGILQEVIVTPENVAVTNGVFTNLSYTVIDL